MINPMDPMEFLSEHVADDRMLPEAFLIAIETMIEEGESLEAHQLYNDFYKQGGKHR